MDGATIAILTTSVSGFVLGAAGLWQSHRRDEVADLRAKDTASIEAKDVATRVTEQGLAVLQAALSQSESRVQQLMVRVAGLEDHVARCEDEKIELRRERAELLAFIEEHRG